MRLSEYLGKTQGPLTISGEQAAWEITQYLSGDDPVAARDDLGSMLAYTEEPTLTEEQLDSLLARSAVADSLGRAPGATGYVESYDLNRGAAEGWRWKAARAAGRFTFGSDVHSYNRSDVAKHCQEMADRYAAKVHGTVPLAAAGEWDPVSGN